MQPLGNPVDKQVSDREFRQIAAGKRLVLGPQPLGDLADRRAAQEAAAIRTGKHRLDVARRQPARIHLHRQSLQLLGAAPHHFPNARAERLLPIGNLRRAVFDGALRARHPTPPVAVAIPGAGLGAAGVVIAPQRVSRFAFQRFLDDQPRPPAAPAPNARPPPRFGRPSALSASRVSARIPVSSPSGCSFVEAGRQTGPRWFRLSGEGAPQPFFQQAYDFTRNSQQPKRDTSTHCHLLNRLSRIRKAQNRRAALLEVNEKTKIRVPRRGRLREPRRVIDAAY